MQRMMWLRGTGALVLLRLALCTAAVALRGDAPSCRSSRNPPSRFRSCPRPRLCCLSSLHPVLCPAALRSCPRLRLCCVPPRRFPADANNSRAAPPPPARAHALTCRADHANASARLSAAPRPVARLRGGQAALDLGDPDLDLGSQVSTSTHQRHRTPFWLTGEEPPARKSVSEQGDMVMLQGFNWKILEDRRTLYQQLADEMGPLAAAGVKTVWFPPPSESADVAGYLPSRWYNITNRTLLDAAIQAAHDNGIVPMVSLLELQQHTALLQFLRARLTRPCARTNSRRLTSS